MKTVEIKKIIICVCLFFANKSKGQELQKLIDQALENNPQIHHFEKKYERISEKKKEVNSIPNTEVGAGFFTSTPETRTGAQRFKLSLKQMIPWFGTISARENYIETLSEANYQEIVIAKRKLINAVSQLYYRLYGKKALQKLLIQTNKLLRMYEKFALRSVEVNQASVVDVLKLQIRQNEIKQQKEILQEQLLGVQASLNKLLNRSAGMTIQVPDTLILIKNSEVITMKNLEIHPELVKYDKLYTSVIESEKVNEKSAHPSIGFGIDYINVQKRSEVTFDDNGKDVLMPMISLSIPIFNRKSTSISKQNKLRQEELIFQKQERKNILEASLKNAIANQNSTLISYQTNKNNLKQARNAERILLKGYETGTIDFDDIIDIQELQLKFQMNMIKSIVNYYLESSYISYLIR